MLILVVAVATEDMVATEKGRASTVEEAMAVARDAEEVRLIFIFSRLCNCECADTWTLISLFTHSFHFTWSGRTSRRADRGVSRRKDSIKCI